MKKEITVKAKTLEEAIAQAAAELGVEAEKIEYSVITEAKKGFLGIGASDCEITASYVPSGEKDAVAFIQTILDDMHIEATIGTSYNEDGDFVIDVNGEGSGVLIGHHGDTLDALQYLVNLAANRRWIELEPNNPAAHSDLGRTLATVCRWKEAKPERLPSTMPSKCWL